MINREYQIYKARSENLNAVKDLEQECKLSPWSINDYENELKRNDSIFYVAIKNDEVTGFLLARLIMNYNSNSNVIKILNISNSDSNYNFIELFNIGIRKNDRRKGLAELLLEKLIADGSLNNADHIFLDVRKSNEPAVRLYDKFGFDIIYERKDFYRDPVENGLGMKLSLIKNAELDMD